MFLSVMLLMGCPAHRPPNAGPRLPEAVGAGTDIAAPRVLEPSRSEGAAVEERSEVATQDTGPIDTDGDQIADAADTCPNEPGVPQFGGCAAATCVELTATRLLFEGTIRFEVNRATIRPHSFALLDQIVAVLLSHPGIHVRVEGHSDDRESDAAAISLSTWRARAVGEYLVQHGVMSRQTEVRGFGDNRPLVPNDNDAHRAQNRRIEFHVEYR